MCPCVCASGRSRVRAFVGSSVRPFVHSSVHPFVGLHSSVRPPVRTTLIFVCTTLRSVLRYEIDVDSITSDLSATHFPVSILSRYHCGLRTSQLITSARNSSPKEDALLHACARHPLPPNRQPASQSGNLMAFRSNVLRSLGSAQRPAMARRIRCNQGVYLS